MSTASQAQGLVITCGDCRLHGPVRKFMRTAYQLYDENYYLYVLPGSFLPAHKTVRAQAPSDYLAFRGHLSTYLNALLTVKKGTGPLRIYAFYHVSADGRRDDCAGWCELNKLLGSLDYNECWRDAACGLEAMAEEIAGALGRECEVVLHQVFLSDVGFEHIQLVKHWDVLNQLA